jgi:mRNA-degrading endonuclease toxin of MazEF toxin-antitoxin module
MSPHPGEIWLADLGLAAKTRPVVILSRYDPEAPRALVISWKIRQGVFVSANHEWTRINTNV